MTKAQKKIEYFHDKLMDIRDATPIRRGFASRNRKYELVYRKAYKESRLTDFYMEAERFRLFLQENRSTRAVKP